jgi:hypothetical protein
MFINKEGFSDLIAELALNNNHSLSHSLTHSLGFFVYIEITKTFLINKHEGFLH